MSVTDFDAKALFSLYMQVVGTPTLGQEPARPGIVSEHVPDESKDQDHTLRGMSLGIINGATWTSLWSLYFGRQFMPTVKLINVGNEAIQLNFMAAHKRGETVPPQSNIDRFVQYAEDLVALRGVQAILITCSTMNRSAAAVREAMARHGIRVVQIDEAMMDAAVDIGGTALVVATHGPTVKSTELLLRETAERRGKALEYCGVTTEEAFDLLGTGDIDGHNLSIANAIRGAQLNQSVDCVVLAQLSMSLFKLSYPDSRDEFGVPVLTSGETGFLEARRALLSRSREDDSPG